MEKWNENIEKCSGCGIEWKKIGKPCPVCFAPPEKHDIQKKEQTFLDRMSDVAFEDMLGNE